MRNAALAVMLLASCAAPEPPDPQREAPAATSESPPSGASGGATPDPPPTSVPRAPACEATSPRPGKVEIVVTPDDGDARVIELVTNANTSIDVTIYQLYSRTVIGALTAAAKRGVRVRVIQDWKEASSTTMTTLGDAGVLVKTSSRAFRYTHQKTLIADGKVAFVFSGNFDRQSFGSGRNFGAVVDDEDDVVDLLELFEADWEERAPNLSCTRLVVSPLNSRTRILALIGSATKRLDVEAMYVTDTSVIDAITKAKSRGIAVRVLLNDPSHEIGDSPVAVGRLSQAGIEVRRSGTLFIHAKLIVVDGVHAFVGSENFSDNSLDNNREAGLVVSSPSADVARIVATFEGDWTKSTEYAAP
jgi:cardiolipin synthase A/B